MTALHHVEFQAKNEARFGVRMLGYYYYLVSTHGQHVVQTVLYVGRDPLRLEAGYQSPSMDFRFEVVNLRGYDAEPLLASDDWADVALALLAKGDPEKALAVAIDRLRKMESKDRGWASGTVLLLSGILGIEETVNERMKEAGMIDVMENKVLAPLMLKRFELGVDEGVQKGAHNLLSRLLTDKFGVLPEWATSRLQTASSEELQEWAMRVLHADSLEGVLR